MFIFQYSSFISSVRFSLLGLCMSVATLQASEVPLGDVDPHKARRSVQKVKALLHTMQAREKDYGAVFGVFADKFKDPDNCPPNALEVIDPLWTKLYQSSMAKNRVNAQNMHNDQARHFVNHPKGHHQRATQQKSLQEKKQLMSRDLISKKSTITVAYRNFSTEVQRSKNVVSGLGSLFELCDAYLAKEEEVDVKLLQRITNSLLVSHLYGLKHIVQSYFLHEGSTDANLSFNRDEINGFYTQERRIPALSQVHYIEDYVHLIATMMKLGLKMEDENWCYAEKLKQYIKRKISLDDLYVFLQDGYFFHKGLEKDQTSHLLEQVIGVLTRETDMSAVVSHVGDAVPLTKVEKKAARQEFSLLCQAHQKRVKDYIKGLDERQCQHIEQSRVFLYGALGEETLFAPVREVDETQSHTSGLSHKTKAKKKNRRPNRQKKQQVFSSQEEMLDLKTLEACKGARPQEKGTLAQSSLVNDNAVNCEGVQQASSQQADLQAEDIKREASSKAQLLSQEKKSLRALQIQTPTPPPQKSLVVTKPSNQRFEKDKMPVFKEKEEARTRVAMNKTSAKILHALQDPTASPFTISYAQALNAMGKIGIMELESKRKGDFRKLVRVDEQGIIIGRVFAYRPATSTLGYELMHTYRDFIKVQLLERPDLARLF